MWPRGLCWPLAVLILGLTACSSTGQPVTHASARPSARPSAAVAADAQRCARLARRGFTPCPPTPDRLTLPATKIVNATNGAISDATAQLWGQALRVAQGYYYWAMENSARDALTSGVLTDSTPQALTNLFRYDLQDLDATKQAGGTLVFRPLAMPVSQIVVVPMALQAAMQRQGLVATGYAIAVRFVGPGGNSLRIAEGNVTPLHTSDPGATSDGMVWGELKVDPDLGTIWYEHGTYGCDGEVRNVCHLA